MDRIAVTLALLALLLGSCGAPKQTAPAQETAAGAETSSAADTQAETDLTFPPAPADGDTPAGTVPDASGPAPAEPEEDGMTNPPAPWLTSDAPAADALETHETDTVPVMPEDVDVPQMPDVNG